MQITAMLVLALLLGPASDVVAKPPVAGPLEIFANGIAGPEGLAFTRRDGLVVGTTTGDLITIDADGNQSVLASVGDSLAGITVLRDGRILAAALNDGRVWAVDPGGATSVFASGIGGPNSIVQTRRKQRILVSASITGDILDITDGTPVVVASGLSFPNGLAIGRANGGRFLYIAETLGSRVSRLPLDRNDVLGPGPAEVVATGLPFADGLAFDRGRNLLVVGGGVFRVIRADTGAVETLTNDLLLDFPTNIAFGRSRGFKRRDVYVVNFGFGLGDGTTVVRFRYNQGGVGLIR
jgi:sugar lactone lactonase YvrE